MKRKWIGLLIVGIVYITLGSLGSVRTIAQVLVSATPARITLPDSTEAPVAEDPLFPTETPTRTPTPEFGAFLEANEGEVNVRADPSTDAEIYGKIRPGDQYRVRGRYFRWIQFEYPNSPTGLGWVFDELVTLTGDTNSIDDLSVTPTFDPLAPIPTLTSASPSDAGVQLGSVDDLANSGGAAIADAGITPTILPTFTYPPNIVAQAPTQGPSATPTLVTSVLPDISVSDGVAPIVPIVVLGVFGMMGLIFSLTRRR